MFYLMRSEIVFNEMDEIGNGWTLNTIRLDRRQIECDGMAQDNIDGTILSTDHLYVYKSKLKIKITI